MRRKRTVGIYLIRNNTTGRVYVGQSKHTGGRKWNADAWYVAIY